jgi:WD40 repeat protein
VDQNTSPDPSRTLAAPEGSAPPAPSGATVGDTGGASIPTEHREAAAAVGGFLKLSQEGFAAAPDPSGGTLNAGPEQSSRSAALSVSGSPPPVAVPGYEILGELGRGGMGVVYKARQVGLKRLVALKMVLAGGYATAHQIARFRAEAEAVARLQHPGIVQVYEIGEHDGHPFFSMEFVDGPSLSQHLARELPPPGEAADLVARLADAVRFAHSQGIIHRDLKPGNILLQRSEVRSQKSEAGGRRGSSDLCPLTSDLWPKIADFGLAKQAHDDAGLTATGAVMGTPSYMAPEQASGEAAVGPAADVYALGAILYECLTGRPPFRAPTLADTLDQVRRAEPVPPARLQGGVPRDLEVICLKCLQKEPARRYATAEELAADLGRFLAGKTIRARPVGPAERAWRWCRRNPVVAVLLAACVLSLVGGSVASAVFALRANRASDVAMRAKDAAEASAVEAVAAKGEAERTAREIRAATVRGHIASGNYAAEAGDISTALLWYAKAWEEDRPLGSPDAPHRSRVAGALGRLPALAACFFHPEIVLQVRWHPTGRWLATRTDGNTVSLWDVRDPAAAEAVLDHPARVTHFEFGDGGALLAACVADGTCSVWDIPSGRRRVEIPHPAPVLWCAFDSIRPRLATACEDGKVRFFDANTGAADGPVIEVQGPASFVAFDAWGSRVLWATDTDRAGVNDAVTGQVVCPPVEHRRRQLRVPGERFGATVEPAFRPDGAAFAGAWDGPFVRATEGGAVLHQRKQGGREVKRVAFSPDGRRVLVEALALAWWWTPEADRAVGLDHPREAWVGAVGPDGTRVVTASSSGKVHIWDPAAGNELTPPLQHAGEVLAIEFSPDGSCVAAAGTDGTTRVWRLDNPALAPEPVPSTHHDSFLLSYRSADTGRIRRISRDGRFAMDYDPAAGTVTVRRRDSGAEVLTAPAPDLTSSPGFSPDGRVLYMVGKDEVRLWDLESGRCAVPSAPLSGALVSVTAAGGRVLVIDSERFQAFDLETGARVLGPTGQGADDPPAWGPAADGGYKIGRGDISADGRRVVIPGGAYRVLRTYDLASGRVTQVPLHDGLVYRAAFAPDGRRVLSCASDMSARLWDPATGEPAGPALWHPSFVRDGALGPDGRTAATYSDGDLRVWDCETGDLLLPPLPHPKRPRPSFVLLSFSHDGSRVVCLDRSDKTDARTRLVRWALPTFAAAPQAVGPLASLMTGRHVDPTRGLSPLRDDDIRRDRDSYRRAFLAYHTSRPPLPPLPDVTGRPPLAPPPRARP